MDNKNKNATENFYIHSHIYINFCRYVRCAFAVNVNKIEKIKKIKKKHNKKFNELLDDHRLNQQQQQSYDNETMYYTVNSQCNWFIIESGINDHFTVIVTFLKHYGTHTHHFGWVGRFFSFLDWFFFQHNELRKIY